MERRQAFQFELQPNGEQQRQMSRSAGCARYVYNKALALKKERYEKKEPLTRFQLDKMLVQCKQEKGQRELQRREKRNHVVGTIVNR